MKGQYQSMYMYNSSPIISSYSNNFSSETKKVYGDDINSYNNTKSDEMQELINYSSIEPSYINSHIINIFEDSKISKQSNFNKDLSSPLSSLSSSSNSSTTSLSLPSPSIYSPSIYSPSLSTLSTQSIQNSLSNELYRYIKPYSYEPLYMKVPEIKKEFIKSNPKTNFISKFNIFFRPFTIYPSGKIDRIWRYLVIWSILLSLICYLVSLNFIYRIYR